MSSGDVSRKAGAGVYLLMALAVGLCGLSTFQWWREHRLDLRLRALQGELQGVQEARLEADRMIVRYRQEIERLEVDRRDLRDTVAALGTELSQTKSDLDKLAFESESALSQLEAFQEALEKANESILQQNEGIRKMNDEFRRLAQDRNEAVEKYNDLARQYDQLGRQYNELVARYNEAAGSGRR
jgi:chromosome segregation ATPase